MISSGVLDIRGRVRCWRRQLEAGNGAAPGALNDVFERIGTERRVTELQKMWA